MACTPAFSASSSIELLFRSNRWDFNIFRFTVMTAGYPAHPMFVEVMNVSSSFWSCVVVVDGAIGNTAQWMGLVDRLSLNWLHLDNWAQAIEQKYLRTIPYHSK